MITDKQREYLEELLSRKTNKEEDPGKYSTYHIRIRERIDHMFENLLWLAEYAPHILTDEEYEIQELDTIKHRRLKWLLETVKKITPQADPILVKARRKIHQDQSE